MKGTLVREYTHPDKQYADAAGNMQVLPNGNVFVGWGRGLAISEFSEDGEMLFDATLLRKNESYRAFRFSWSARPVISPLPWQSVSPKRRSGSARQRNGATEVATWEILAARHQGRLKSLGQVPRNGFETAMVVRTSDPYVAVRAKDSSGRALGTSKVLRPGSWWCCPASVARRSASNVSSMPTTRGSPSPTNVSTSSLNSSRLDQLARLSARW